MTRPIIALSVAIAASVVASGCAYRINHWPHQLNPAPASRQYRPHRIATHESSGANDESRMKALEGMVRRRRSRRLRPQQGRLSARVRRL